MKITMNTWSNFYKNVDKNFTLLGFAVDWAYNPAYLAGESVGDEIHLRTLRHMNTNTH